MTQTKNTPARAGVFVCRYGVMGSIETRAILFASSASPIEFAGSALTTNSRVGAVILTLSKPRVYSMRAPGTSDCWLSLVKMCEGKVGSTALKYHEPLSRPPMFLIWKRTAIRSVDLKLVAGVNAPLMRSRVPISIISETKSTRPVCMVCIADVFSMGYVFVVIGPGSITGAGGGVVFVIVELAIVCSFARRDTVGVVVAVVVAVILSRVLVVEVAIAVDSRDVEDTGSLWKSKIAASEATRSFKVGNRRNERANNVPIATMANDAPITGKRDRFFSLERVETVPLPMEISFALFDIKRV